MTETSYHRQVDVYLTIITEINKIRCQILNKLPHKIGLKVYYTPEI